MKRYALFVRDSRGEPVIVKASEHGLGHLLDPTGNADDPRAWMRLTWLWIIHNELGLPAPVPAWFALPAVGGVPVSSPAMRRPFTDLNRGRSYDETVKPFNFVLAAHVRPFGHPSCVEPEHFQLVAPFETNPPEVDRILGALDVVRSSDELAVRIHQLFVSMFAEQIAGSAERYRAIADEIWRVAERQR